jgi:hypothetical protein
MKTTLSLLAVSVSVLNAAPVSAWSAHPRVSMHTARARALALVPNGTIRSAELEREHGIQIYSFDIEIPHRAGVEEIQISAATGRLVSRTHESPAAEHRESQTERAEHGRR